MHIAISWDINAEDQRWKSIDRQMRKAIRQYSWVRPLSTFYVVEISSKADRNIIVDNLLKVAESVSETVHFLATPLMASGLYDGYLPEDSWDEINERTG